MFMNYINIILNRTNSNKNLMIKLIILFLDTFSNKFSGITSDIVLGLTLAGVSVCCKYFFL